MQHNIFRSRNAQYRRSLLAVAGLAVAASTASTAHAVSEERFFLRWNEWASMGIDGATAVTGNIDGAQVNPNHIAWLGQRPIQLAYPIPANEDRIHFITAHATAALGAVGARNPTIGTAVVGGGLIGFAPGAKLLAGSFASGFRIEDGSFDGLGTESIFFALMAMTDQDFADAVQPYLFDSDGLPLPPYRVATVVNISFGVTGTPQRVGEDPFAQLANIVSYRTDATLVASGGNLGEDAELDDLDPDEGSVVSPGTAHNVIAVGYTETGQRGAVADMSSEGPSPTFDIVADPNIGGAILPQDVDPMDCPDPGARFKPESRTTIDIVAPGTELELPGNFAVNPLSDSAILRGWTGTSFSSGIVTGALTLMHDLHRRYYFQANPGASEFDRAAVLPQEATRAILLASGNKEQGWSNGSFPDDTNVSSTESPLDPRLGGGRLDMRKLLRTYLGTPVLQGYRDILPGSGIVFSFRRDPSITDPTDLALRQANSYIARFNGQPVIVDGTPGTVPVITRWKNPNQGTGPSVGRSTAPGSDRTASRTATTSDSVSGSDLDLALLGVHEQILETPSGKGEGLDTPSGGGTGGGGSLGGTSDGGLTGGTNTGSGSGGSSSGGGSTGGAGTSWGAADAYKSGWDYGMIGMGLLDIPMGLVTEQSDITVALTWKRKQVLDERIVDAIIDSVVPGTRESFEAERIQLEKLDALDKAYEDSLNTTTNTRSAETIKAEQSILVSPEPTIMAGVTYDPDADDNVVTPAESDSPAMRIDPNTTTSPYRGVCHVRVNYQGIAYYGSGVIIGPHHIATAAHLVDLNNDGLVDTGDVTITFNGVGSDNQQLVIPRAQVRGVDVPAEFSGFGVPNGLNVNDDLCIITLDDAIDFGALGLPVYPYWQSQGIIPPGNNNPPEDRIQLVLVGYGPTGSGLTGVSGSIAQTNEIKRVGRNEFADRKFGGDDQADDPTDFETFVYDFDPPPGSGLVSNVIDGPSLGNQLESMALNGDSGGPAFLWFDTAPPDGIVQEGELRTFGINTFKAVGSANEATPTGKFGNLAGGPILSAYNDFIDGVLNPNVTPLPPLGPDIGFGESLPDDQVSFQYVDLNLSLFRRSFDGNRDILVAQSTSMFDTVEMVHVTDDDQILFGDYFIRIEYALERVDLGGFQYCGLESTPYSNRRQVIYENNFDAEVNYGLAWYIDLTPDRDLDASFFDGSRSNTTASRSERYMGDMNLDTRIDGTDLSLLLSRWGATGEAGNLRGDLSRDGFVSSDDLAILLSNWTGPRPQ